MELPAWVEELWIELRFKQLVLQEPDIGYQRLFQRVMKAVDGDDFVDVRPAGRGGDLKCDGWSTSASTCYAVYAPYTWKSLATVRHKVEDDFRGALAAWPTMRGWRLVHNDMHGLHAPVAAALEDLRAEASRSMSEVQILPPWGPNELCWLLRQAPRSAQWAILGAPAWHASRLPLGDLTDYPVQVAAGRSVAQLIDNFPPGGVCEPIAATSLASALAAFLLGDQAMFEARVSVLAQRCEDEPFEPMLTAVVFCAKAIDQWESASKCPARLLTDSWIATGQANEYVIDLVLAAREGVDPPGHCCICCDRAQSRQTVAMRTRRPPPRLCRTGCVRRLLLPSRRDRAGRSLVPALRVVVPRRRGAVGRTRHPGRPRHDLPLGPALHAPAGRGCPALPPRRR
jgi:hypothetical protein